MPSFSLNVPLLAQRDRADCLPICVAMVLAYYGRMDDESVTVNDPAFPVQQRVSRAEFLLAWSDLDYLYALIRPEQD